MIEVLSPGFFTTLQDQGRFGYRHLGVPLSGAMDSKAYALAIALLPFENDSCVFECTLIGPTLKLKRPFRFVLTGGEMEAWLNEAPLKINRVYIAEKGSVLKLGKSKEGIRTYLRFQAQLDVIKYLGSVSYFHPITPSHQLKKGDQFNTNDCPSILEENLVHLNMDTSYLAVQELLVRQGPDWSQLNSKQQEQLLAETHKIISHNRMGYRLSTALKVDVSNLLSQLVLPGMIQLTPGGELLIATADCQVTGGYLQVLQLIEESLAVLAQKREGEVLTFRNTLV